MPLHQLRHGDNGLMLRPRLWLSTLRCDGRVEVAGGRRRGACGRWIVTLALCAAFLGLGMSISITGPTFEDLAVNVNKSISNLSYILVGHSAGYIGGSLFGGLLFDCMSPYLLLGCSLLVTSVGMCAIPFCRQALLLTCLMSSIGLTTGILDTANTEDYTETQRKSTQIIKEEPLFGPFLINNHKHMLRPRTDPLTTICAFGHTSPQGGRTF
ncbi:sodium-dependent glucose transporter 1-like [Pseudochaenichthys georgianus]|uniref:sodium-dependent glucose transporter 1-like n=1 Tax=Pseudochaenichthys georgianus TaxID=52239 RepID=UPI0039C3CBBB